MKSIRWKSRFFSSQNLKPEPKRGKMEIKQLKDLEISDLEWVSSVENSEINYPETYQVSNKLAYFWRWSYKFII